MAQPEFYPPHPPMHEPLPQNGLGTAGFVLGLLGLSFSPIPLIGVIAWPLVMLGLVFSLVGIGRANNRLATNRGLAVAGLVLSILGLLTCVMWLAAIGAMV